MYIIPPGVYSQVKVYTASFQNATRGIVVDFLLLLMNVVRMRLKSYFSSKVFVIMSSVWEINWYRYPIRNGS